MRIGIVSGYFNPLHEGHIDYINESKNSCDFLIAIVNNDKQVQLKQSIPFMDENHRCSVIKNLKNIDNVILSCDKDGSVCLSIKNIVSWYQGHKILFFNSGDRVNNSDSIEKKYIESLGVEYIKLPLPKKYSSSELIKNAAEFISKKQMRGSVDVKIKTLFPVALDSPDHITPVGTKNDNNTNLKLIDEIENYFKKSISFLDIGCSGGQFAVDFFERKHLSVGIEGSDYSVKYERANWPDYYGKVLFTCDASKEYFITDDKDHLIFFDCISSWEVIEHIHPNRLDQFFQNIKNHMNKDSIFIGTISLRTDVDKLHQSVFPENVWKNEILYKHFDIYDYPFKEKVRHEKDSFLFLVKLKSRVDKIKI